MPASLSSTSLFEPQAHRPRVLEVPGKVHTCIYKCTSFALNSYHNHHTLRASWVLPLWSVLSKTPAAGVQWVLASHLRVSTYMIENWYKPRVWIRKRSTPQIHAPPGSHGLALSHSFPTLSTSPTLQRELATAGVWEVCICWVRTRVHHTRVEKPLLP